MDMLILGGASQRHKEWVRQAASAFKPYFERVAFIDYHHWDAGGKTDIAYELGRAAAAAQALSPAYAIVAKSVGTVLTLLGVASGRLQPARCVLLGMPLDAIRAEWHAKPGVQHLTEGIAKPEDTLALLPPTVIIQNGHDPYGSADAVRRFVAAGGNPKVSVLERPGDTHDYVDFELITEKVLE